MQESAEIPTVASLTQQIKCGVILLLVLAAANDRFSVCIFLLLLLGFLAKACTRRHY